MILLLIAVIYMAGAVLGGYLHGRVRPNEDSSIDAAVFWPVSVPLLLAEWARQRGKARARHDTKSTEDKP